MFQQVLQAKLWTSPRVLGDPVCNEWLLILFHQPSTMTKKKKKVRYITKLKHQAS
jgi:hypothetical protein